MARRLRSKLTLVVVTIAVIGVTVVMSRAIAATNSPQAADHTYKFVDLHQIKNMADGEQAMNAAAKGGWHVVAGLGQNVVVFER